MTSGLASTDLKVREWLAVSIVIVALFCLGAVTQLKGSRVINGRQMIHGEISRPTVEVIVKGAVSLPGIYQLPQEITLGKLLDLVKPMPEADLSRWRLDAPLRKGRLIFIKEREQISVYLSGAVKNSGVVKVAKGTTLEKLLESAELDAQADVGALNQKRKVRANELIEVPFRKVL